MANAGTGGQMVTPPDETTTDPYAVIAALRQQLAESQAERDAALRALAERSTELAHRNSEYGEHIAHQSATIDVLRVMSASPGDPQPVFDLICRQAETLLDGPSAALFEYDGEFVYLRADSSSFFHLTNAAAYAAYMRGFPMVPVRGSLTCRAILDGAIVHIRDLTAEPGISRAVLDLGHRTQVSIPLMRNGRAIGAISAASMQVDGISDSQVALLQTFAAQAVIAIISAETYRELEVRTESLAQRNAQYREKIEHQAATIDVLKVMSASPGDPQPVFDLIVRQAREQCNSTNAGIYEYDGMIHFRSIASGAVSSEELAPYARLFPMRLEQEPNNVVAVSIRDRRIVHFDDGGAVGALTDFARSLGTRSGVVIPLIKGDAAIGCIAMSELRSGSYSDSQIELLKTFAEQAVIAINSAETYRALQARTADLQQSLEYQTATSDVLQVISQSQFDLQPVLDTMVATAARLCDAEMAAIGRREGDGFRLVASLGLPPEFEADRQRRGIIPYTTRSVSGRAVLERRVIHVPDAAAEPGYAEMSVKVGRQRTSLGVPLMREGEVIGSMLLARQRVEPFTD
jgi:GAF domain-containing protein